MYRVSQRKNNNCYYNTCSASCATFADNVPLNTNSGTEFIVIQLRNQSPNPVYLRSVQINGISHLWDERTAGKTLDASLNDQTGKYQQAGKFSIIGTSSLVQKSDNKVNEDEEVRLVIKLSKDVSPEISLNKPIRAWVDFGSQRSSELAILSGDAR